MASPSLGAKIQMLSRRGLRSIPGDGLLLTPIWAAWAPFGQGGFGIAPGGLGGAGEGEQQTAGGSNGFKRHSCLQSQHLPAAKTPSLQIFLNILVLARLPPPADPSASSGEREDAASSPACARSCREPCRELQRKGRRGHLSTPSQEPSPCFNRFPDVRANPAKLPAMNN